MFAGNVATQKAEEMEPNCFQHELEDERCYQTAISDYCHFQNFENNYKKYVQKLSNKKKSNFQITRIYVKERY